MIRKIFTGLVAVSMSAIASAQTVVSHTVDQGEASLAATLVGLDADFARWMADSNVPGLVWGIVHDGKLIHIRALGVQDVETKSPVTAETAFRIASMSKAFTGFAILKLRDQQKLRLDDPVSKFIPEVRRWGRDITVSNLLHHTAGFVTDDPWGDRQQPMPEVEFTKLLKTGVPLSSGIGSRFEYSNFGYAMLGRIVSNASGVNFSTYIGNHVFKPLEMPATSYEVGNVPASRLAAGYRWEGGAWLREPSMAHGAFGAMGGVVTSGNDYAKWVNYLAQGLAMPEDGIPSDPVLWKMQDGGGFPQARRRPGKSAPDCRLSAVYAAGLISGNDCELGHVLFHGGGFPGYGSHMLVLPETGTGIFALSNRTYAGPSGPVWDAATKLLKLNIIKKRNRAVSMFLHTSYTAAKTLWENGGFDKIDDRRFAMNFFMDRKKPLWAKQLNEIQGKVGTCNTDAPLIANGRLSGNFEWQCEKGKIKGSLLLAPTFDPQIQSLNFDIGS